MWLRSGVPTFGQGIIFPLLLTNASRHGQSQSFLPFPFLPGPSGGRVTSTPFLRPRFLTLLNDSFKTGLSSAVGICQATKSLTGL